MAYYYKYPINYAPNESGDTTAFAVKQLIRERNYIYQILNNIVAGNTAFVKAGVLVATTGNISLSGEKTIDGVSVEEGDRVLVWKQGNSVENGVYVVSKGQWKRADDADDDGDFANGYFTGVARGTYAGQLFTQEGDVSVNVSPLNFRNVIQGDMVSREVYRARDEANQAKETARGYADNANESKEQAETAKAAAEEAAKKAGTAQTETEKANENVLLKEKSVENYYNEVVKMGKEVTDNQNKATDIFRNVLAKQGDLENKQQEIQREQDETSQLLEEAQQERTVIIQSVADGKLYAEESKKASISAKQSEKNAEKSEIDASQSMKTINELVDNVNTVHEKINVQVQKAETVNEETKVIEAKALQTKTEIENLKGETESARDDAINRWNTSKTILDNTLLEAQNAKHGAEEAKAGAEKESAAAKVSEANAKNSANMSAIEAEKARVEAGNAKTEAVNAGTEVEKAKAEVLKAQTEAERALTHSNKSEEAETEARKEAEKAKTAADKAENTLQAALATLDLNSYAKKESLVGLATTDYVDGRFNHIIGTSAEALDTLEEIGKALGNDADFAGTMTKELTKKADKGTVENALLGKATKEELATKADKTAVYLKTESDRRYQAKGDYVTLTKWNGTFKSNVSFYPDSSNRYTYIDCPGSPCFYFQKPLYGYLNADEIANVYLNKTDAESKYLTKTSAMHTYLTQYNAGNIYQKKGDYATKTDLANIDLSSYAEKTSVYTKTETDGKFFTQLQAAEGLSKKADKDTVYLKTESDSKYQTKEEAQAAGGLIEAYFLSKYDANNIYISKVDADKIYQVKTNVYTKTESDRKYQLKGDYVTESIWNAVFNKYINQTIHKSAMLISFLDVYGITFNKPLIDYFNKQESDGRYQAKGDYATNQKVDEKTGEINNRINGIDNKVNTVDGKVNECEKKQTLKRINATVNTDYVKQFSCIQIGHVVQVSIELHNYKSHADENLVTGLPKSIDLLVFDTPIHGSDHQLVRLRLQPDGKLNLFYNDDGRIYQYHEFQTFFTYLTEDV